MILTAVTLTPMGVACSQESMPSVMRSHIFQPPFRSYTKSMCTFREQPDGRQVAVKVFDHRSTRSAEDKADAKPPEAPRSLLLYCHGNAEDLGCIDQDLTKLSKALDVPIVSFDYFGYGLSSNEGMNEEGLHTAAKVACCFATEQAEEYSVKWNQKVPIIVMGRSLGCVPAVFLCSDVSTRFRIRGLVLISAFASGADVIMDTSVYTASMRTWMRNMFGNNVARMKDVAVPTVLVHGKNDTTVPVRNLKLLRDSLPTGTSKLPYELNFAHNDLFGEDDNPAYNKFVEVTNALIARIHRQTSATP